MEGESHTRTPWLVGFAFFTLYLLYSLGQYRKYSTGIDLGLYTQSVKGYASLGFPYSTLKSIAHFNMLGDHFTPVVALIAPFYWLHPGAPTLIVAQDGLFALSVVITTRFAIKILGRRRGAVVGAAYGLSWGVQEAIVSDFHEISLAMPLIALALQAIIEKKYRRSFYLLLPLLLVKEDMGLLLIGVGLSMVLYKQLKLSAALIGTGAVGIAVTVGWIIPSLSYSGRYSYWNSLKSTDVKRSLFVSIAHQATETLSSRERASTLLALLAVTLFLALRSPLVVAIVPMIITRFTSSTPAYWGTSFHYNAIPMVVLFFALIEVLAAPRRMKLRSMAPPAALGFAIIMSFWNPLSPRVWSTFPFQQMFRPSWYQCSYCGGIDSVIKQVPKGSRVATDARLSSHMINKASEVYDLSPTMTDTVGHSFDEPRPGSHLFVLTERLSGMFPSGPTVPGIWTDPLQRRLLASGDYRIISATDQAALLERTS